MIKIVEKPEEKRNESLKLQVGDTLCCWDGNDVPSSVDKNYLMVVRLTDLGDLRKPYTIIALNDTCNQCKATNTNDKLCEYFYSNLDDLAQDMMDNYDHVKKVDLVATVKESSNDED